MKQIQENFGILASQNKLFKPMTPLHRQPARWTPAILPPIRLSHTGEPFKSFSLELVLRKYQGRNGGAVVDAKGQTLLRIRRRLRNIFWGNTQMKISMSSPVGSVPRRWHRRSKFSTTSGSSLRKAAIASKQKRRRMKTSEPFTKDQRSNSGKTKVTLIHLADDWNYVKQTYKTRTDRHTGKWCRL